MRQTPHLTPLKTMQLTPAQLAANAHYEATLAQVKEFCAANNLPALYETIAPNATKLGKN